MEIIVVVRIWTRSKGFHFKLPLISPVPPKTLNPAGSPRTFYISRVSSRIFTVGSKHNSFIKVSPLTRLLRVLRRTIWYSIDRHCLKQFYNVLLSTSRVWKHLKHGLTFQYFRMRMCYHPWFQQSLKELYLPNWVVWIRWVPVRTHLRQNCFCISVDINGKQHPVKYILLLCLIWQ